MRILVCHPVMTFLGGGERLCCETIRALLSVGYEVTVLSEVFDTAKTESFFGYNGLFDRVNLCLYPPANKPPVLGATAHIIHHLRGQKRALKQFGGSLRQSFDLVFSTQDAGYIPDISLPVIQWGYFPRSFPRILRAYSPHTLARAIRNLPLRLHYERKVARIGLVFGISSYSKSHLDREWKRPSVLIYPPCNMVNPGAKRNLIVTVARATPVKRLELFWKVAKLRPEYEFAMLITQDPSFLEYSVRLSKESPDNGISILNPQKEVYHRLLSEAKVYLHLMEGEHFGIAIVEAMSASCVPIVHDSGGAKEIVRGEIGFRWQNAEDIPSMIDEAMMKSPSSAARRRAEDFTVGRFEKRLASVFSELRV